MAKTLSINTQPANGAGLTGLLFRGINALIQAFANDHDASHWPYKLSAPLASDFTLTATNGGALTASTTVRFRAVWVTPNGATIASSEFTVALGGAQNAVQIVTPQADDGFTPTLLLFVVPSGGAQGATAYQTRQADVTVTAGTAVVNADGSITMSTGGTSTLKVIAYPPDTQPAHTTYNTNNSGAQDPLPQLMPAPHTQTVSADGTTYTTVSGDTTAIYVYSQGRLASMTVKRKGITIGRFVPTFDTSGNFTGMTQTEG